MCEGASWALSPERASEDGMRTWDRTPEGFVISPCLTLSFLNACSTFVVDVVDVVC
jgi:hypothetical protein